MNFTQLRCFINAIDNSSFTIAARKMNFSQSAVSKNIKDLETELGVTLINRAHHRISLTQAGRYFYKVAYNIVEDMDTTTTYLQNQKEKPGQILRIGYFDTPLEQRMMPLILNNLRQACHNIDVQFIMALNNSVSELLNHHVDICIAGQDTVSAVVDVQFTPLIAGNFVVGCPEHSSLAQHSELTIDDLMNENLFLIDPNTSLISQARFQDMLVNKVGIEHVKFVQDFFAMAIYLKAGWGLGILPNFIADYQTEGITYVPLARTKLPPYGLAYIGSLSNEFNVDAIINSFKKAVDKFGTQT